MTRILNIRMWASSQTVARYAASISQPEHHPPASQSRKPPKGTVDTDASMQPYTSVAMIAAVMPGRTLVQEATARDQPEAELLAAELAVLHAPVNEPLHLRVDCRNAFLSPVPGSSAIGRWPTWAARPLPERDTALVDALSLLAGHPESSLRLQGVRPSVLAALVDRLLVTIEPDVLETRLTLGAAMGEPDAQILLDHRAWRCRKKSRPATVALGRAAVWLARLAG